MDDSITIDNVTQRYSKNIAYRYFEKIKTI